MFNTALIPLTVVALIAGAVYEFKRICTSWQTVVYSVLGAILLSFSSFFPGKHESNYNLDQHIAQWPYFFLGFLIIIAAIFHKNKVTTKLTEGVTLLQSVAIIYWFYDFGMFSTNNIFFQIILGIASLYIIYTFYNAFTYKTLSRNSRLKLSIWSSIISMILAIDYIYNVYQNPSIEITSDWVSKIYIALQYFLLGTCSIYITRNILMLIGFLPGKRTFFNKQYFIDLQELNNDHIERYSEYQVHIFHSIVAILFSTLVYTFNYYYQALPKGFVIWATFFSFPVILNFLPGKKQTLE